jgi:hypothetical protein
MKSLMKLTAAAVALAGLSACDMLGLNKGEGGNGSAATNAATTNAAVPANASADAAPGGKDPAAAGAAPASSNGQVTSAFLVGRWTDNNDCTQTIEFRSDGSFATPDGGQGVWALDGDRLTFQGSSTVSARVQAPNADTITLLHNDGTLGRSTRCRS